jgi:hypothetical protein
MALARETPRVYVNAVEPGFNPGTSLAREASGSVRFVLKYFLPLLAPFMNFWSNPKRAARIITKVLSNESGQTGVYFDDRGDPMLGSVLACDPKFQDRVVAETRTLLSTIPK